MDEARNVLRRLDRIEQLEREGAAVPAVLDELRALVRDAEAWLRAEAEPRAAVDALERLRRALPAQEREVVPTAR